MLTFRKAFTRFGQLLKAAYFSSYALYLPRLPGSKGERD